MLVKHRIFTKVGPDYPYSVFSKTLILQLFAIFALLMISIPASLADSVSIEPELRADQEAPSSSNNVNVDSSIVASQLVSEDHLDMNTNTHRHRRKYGRKHRHKKINSVGHVSLVHNSLATLQIASEYVEMCALGRLNDQRVSWKNDHCETCHCSQQSVLCEQEVCPDLPCDYPVSVEGECCQMCPEALCQAADGRHFRDGAEWHLDDCTFCECKKGKVLCSVEDCEFKTCNNPTKVPGQCCLVCPDTSCHENNGRNYTAGTVWKEGQCTHCYCRKGETVCANEKCPHINCTHPYSRPGECCARCPGAVDCIVSTWGPWSECPIQECGGGMRRRYRSVVIHSRNGGSFCPHMSEAQMCPMLSCNEVPVCPVTAWETWGHCTATCGTGRRLRMRQKAKVTKATMTSLIDCSNTHMQETMPCYTGSCQLTATALINTEPDLDHCLEMTWTKWGRCSVACGVGIRIRSQILVNSSHPLGHLCHFLQESKQCHGHDCAGSKSHPVRCKVTHWSPWTPCSSTCGPTAKRSKHRSIIRYPSVGGRPCPRLRVTRLCKLDPCSIVTQDASDTDGACVSHDGLKHYAENERWNPSECTSCQCVNSRKACQPMFCPDPECSNPMKFPGFCCPFCLGE